MPSAPVAKETAEVANDENT